MKKFAIFMCTILALGIYCNAQTFTDEKISKGINTLPTKNDNGQKQGWFKIIEIRTNDLYNTIYAERNDSLFMILSRRFFSKLDNSQKVKVGELYMLTLNQIYPTRDSISGIEIMPIGIHCKLFGSEIQIAKEHHYSVYEALNIKGLYLTTE